MSVGGGAIDRGGLAPFPLMALPEVARQFVEEVSDAVPGSAGGRSTSPDQRQTA